MRRTNKKMNLKVAADTEPSSTRSAIDPALSLKQCKSEQCKSAETQNTKRITNIATQIANIVTHTGIDPALSANQCKLQALSF